MNTTGPFLSFPAVLLPGMEQAAIVRTAADATDALAGLTSEHERGTTEGSINSVSADALQMPAWGGKNAGRESRFALECAKQLQDLVQGEITDVVICGNSASVSQGYTLETSAAREGWHLFNIFGLPYTLESAAAHTVSVAVSAHGARLALSSGETAGPAALQFVQSLLAEDSSRTIIWGTAEQFSEGIEAVLRAEGRMTRSHCFEMPLCHFEGSILLVATAAKTDSSAFQVIELCNLQSSDDLVFTLSAEKLPEELVKRTFYVNSTDVAADLLAIASPENIVKLHLQFGDGWSINPFIPFLHMLARPCSDELVIILSDKCGRRQLLRAIRLIDE